MNITFVGSRLTRPQARAATPLQLREIATMPIESGPGYTKKNKTYHTTSKVVKQPKIFESK